MDPNLAWLLVIPHMPEEGPFAPGEPLWRLVAAAIVVALVFGGLAWLTAASSPAFNPGMPRPLPGDAMALGNPRSAGVILICSLNFS